MWEVAIPLRQRHKHGLQCQFNNQYQCSKIHKNIWNKLVLPSNACHFQDCGQCLVINQTFIISKDFQLFVPETFILRNSREITDNTSTAYNCFTKEQKYCECDDNCQGTPEFCKFRKCVEKSDCACEMTYEKLDLLAVSTEEVLYNPDILILEICYFDKRQTFTSKKHRRHLLEGEKATFSQRNVSFTFEDPILHLPDTGKVILRSDDFEHVMNVPSDNMIVIPFEYLAYKADIQVIYLHPTGKVVTGHIHVTGKTVCQLRHCFLCYDVIKHFKCYPSIIQYAMYTLLILLIVISLWCMNIILKSFKFLVYAVLAILYALGRLVKIIARCSLLLGAFIGSTFREIIHNCYAALERNANQRANIYTLPLVLLLCTCIFTTVSANCNTHTIIKSDLKSCEIMNDGTKNCQIFTTAEISLKSLSAENCLWFSDEHDNHLFTLKLKLDTVTCAFSKERQYFTFPVATKQISQISCIFNKFCGRGVHCIKRHIGKGGINFEAETSHSRQFPGFSACLSGSSGNGCFVLTRPSCNFHRIWYEPDLLNSYEVSKITGHSCKYHVSVTNVENNTVSRLSISDTAFTPNGIRISILGAYDQPQLYLNDKLIQRVGRVEEAYLAPACERNSPQSNMIGAIQANTSYTTDFIFAPDLTQCDYFEDSLRCITSPDSIERLRASQEYSLPLQKNIHLFTINEGVLQSNQLLSSAVRIQLHFRNYKIALQTSTICPQLEGESITTTGCYNCPILARLTFKAHSSCQPGIASVELQQISIHTKAVYLKLDATTHIVKFQAEDKCASEKLCLKSASLIQCHAFKYCLDEPSVELLNLNTNYTRTVSSVEVDLPLPPEVASSKDGELRLDYHPPVGIPPPNITYHPLDVKDGIVVDDVIPGTEYAFQLYYSNRSMIEVLTWTTVIATEPDPPSNLSVDVQTGKIVELLWEPPFTGGYSGFKLVILSAEDDLSPRTFDLSQDSLSYTLRDLTAGASYEIQLSTIYQDKESSIFISSNFTTKPNTPGRFIVWFRNETTLLVLWQPPYPSGIFDQYRVSISPEDALQSVLFVEKEGEPPGPAQAAFYGLIPGRAYNISVQTVSHNQISEPTEAQYRTVPLPPTNVTYNKSSLTSYSFDAVWSPPKTISEFDRYQVALGIRNSVRQTISRSEKRIAHFNENLEPGRTYEVIVKTVSGNVASWPAAVNITTRPLPVINLSSTAIEAGEILITWSPNNNSLQDSYFVSNHELEAYNGDGIPQVVHATSYKLSDLLPGRNYSISVVALSQGVPSEPDIVYQATRPSSPVIEMLEPIELGWNISWKSDVTSRQDSYTVVWVRNDTGEVLSNTTKENWLLINNLYSGASYEIKVYAISYGLESEPHSYYQTVAPKPPENVQIVKASNSTMILTWIAPNTSVIDYYIVRYRPVNVVMWKEVVVINATSCEIKKLDSGEKYEVQVVSMSNKVECPDAKIIEQTMYPNPIKHVRHILDSYNITFEWNVPAGKKDYYIINYYPVKSPFPQLSHQVPANNTNTDGIMSCMIDDLKPGELYSFLFYVVSHSLRSEGIGLQTRTKPVIDSVIHIVTDEQETKTLGIKYTPTPIRNVVFDRYRFQLSGTNIPAQEKLQNDTNRLVIFDNLIPGRLYNISIWTVSGGVYSTPIDRQARLYPESVGEIMAPKITDTEITLTWPVPDGDKDAYEVQYQDHGGNLIKNITSSNEISYSGLRPHHNYTFLVSVLSGYNTSTTIRGHPMSRTFHTLESVPGKVNNFQAISVKPNMITLQWTLPSSEQNGILTGFVITYFVKGSLFHQYEKFGPTDTDGTIKNLVPGKTYVFEIQAHTKVGPGGKATLEKTLPLGAPPVPASNIFPTSVAKSSSTAKVMFRKNFFSHSNGPVTSYAVIVAEDDAVDSKLQRMPSWNDVQKYSKWPPYQVSEPFYPFNGTSTFEFVIGTEDCSNAKGYCNGPLKPGTSYKVKVRAYTASDKFTDTVYSYSFQTDTDNTAMLVGITVPIILIILLAIVVIVIRQKKRHRPFTKKATDGHMKDDSMSIPESEIITSRPIKLKDFAEHYRYLSADSDFRFSEEFELLKHVGRDKPCNAADLPVNRPKNRFTNILPYDHSRVKLLPSDDEEGSDYINGNYIPGYNSPREFIVTQGPLHSTRDDFWRMIWEQNCRAIIMLTRCVEKGREKCDHYWPYDTQPAYYGDIQVTILNESQYSKWTISEFKVSRGDQSRIVRHFHFTTWPDFGVPDPPQTLVKFVRTFRDRVPPDNKPIVVHCSAGVGRSGTFIALDHILQKIQKHDYVDIFAIVYEMRKERVWMVQNEQQYICIHQCLMCVLEGNEDVMDPMRQEVHENQGYEDDEGIAESGM